MKSDEDLKGKKLLILAGADVHVKVVNAAKELGVYTIVTDYLSPQDSPAKLIADEFWMLDIKDTNDIVERCRKEGIDGVLAFCIDPAQIPYQQICEKLDIPCYGTKKQFEILTNKRLFKQYCLKHGVDVIPEYSIKDAYEGKIEFPVLVKPTDSRGSRGQTVCYSQDDIENAIDIARKESHDNGVIIEQYMHGKQDMSFAYIVINKEPYLLKIGDRLLGKVEDNLERQQIATILPSRHIEQYRRDIEPKVIEMIKSLDITFGAVFLQGFWNNDRVYMYDPGLRFPGSDFDVVMKIATGFDNMKSFVRFALTGDVCSQYGNPRNACELNGGICLILSVSCRPGRIVELKGMDIIKANPHVLSASLRHHINDIIPPSGDIQQRVAEFVAFLPNRTSIETFLSFVYDNLTILDEDGKDMIISKISNNQL